MGMTGKQLDAIRARLEAVTVKMEDFDDPDDQAIEAFEDNACGDIAALLAEVNRLRYESMQLKREIKHFHLQRKVEREAVAEEMKRFHAGFGYRRNTDAS